MLKRGKDSLGCRTQCIQMPEKDRNMKSVKDQSKASVAGVKMEKVASKVPAKAERWVGGHELRSFSLS